MCRLRKVERKVGESRRALMALWWGCMQRNATNGGIEPYTFIKCDIEPQNTQYLEAYIRSTERLVWKHSRKRVKSGIREANISSARQISQKKLCNMQITEKSPEKYSEKMT
jgi:hypothetical protein